MLLSIQLICKYDGVTQQQAYKILPRKNREYQSPSLTLNRTSSADAYLKNGTVIMENYRELKHYRSLQFSPENGPKTHEGKPHKQEHSTGIYSDPHRCLSESFNFKECERE